MSVLPFALPTVQDQLVGWSVHLSPPAKMMSLVVYESVKWNVVEAFKGTPAAVKTPPPLAELVTQSPTSAAGMLANRSPSMPKPPAGVTRGATPVGGGAASVDWLPKTSKKSRTKETSVSHRHLDGELVEFAGINEKCSIGEKSAVWHDTTNHDRPGLISTFPNCEI